MRIDINVNDMNPSRNGTIEIVIIIHFSFKKVILYVSFIFCLRPR